MLVCPERTILQCRRELVPLRMHQPYSAALLPALDWVFRLTSMYKRAKVTYECCQF